MEITFEHGIPGFEHLKSFVLSQEEEDGYFANLHSVEEKEVGFLVVNPFLFYLDYEFNLPESIQDDLKINDETDVEVWAIVTVGAKIEESTINLLAPIVLNRRLRLGRQVILQDTPYHTKHLLIQNISDESGQKG